jgi:hypothetical protein
MARGINLLLESSSIERVFEEVLDVFASSGGLRFIPHRTGPRKECILSPQLTADSGPVPLFACEFWKRLRARSNPERKSEPSMSCPIKS